MAFPGKLALAVSALLGLGAAHAQAAEYQLTAPTQYTPAADAGGFALNGTQYTGDAGRELATIVGYPNPAGPSFQEYAFCIDALTYLYTSSPYTIDPIATVITSSVKQEQLAALLTHAAAAINGSSTPSLAAAGLQLAVWSVVYDSGISGYSLASDSTSNFTAYGQFDVTTGDGSGALGQSYLANIEGTSPTWRGNPQYLKALVSNNDSAGNPLSQDLIFLAAVPEPATWLSMILGFGILGAALRRRKGGIALPLAQ
jgi:hypothetical protein